MPYAAKRLRQRRRREVQRRIEREVTDLVVSAARRSRHPAEVVPREVLIAECAVYFGPFRALIDPYVEARLGGEADSEQKRDELALRLISRNAGLTREQRVNTEIQRMREKGLARHHEVE